jgi:hypothetical protein
MKTVLVAIVLTILCGTAHGYDRNQSLGEEWQQRGQAEESQQINSTARQREMEHNHRMQQLERHGRLQQQENEWRQRQLEAEHTGCGFGRGERCAPWKAANGKPRNAGLWNLSDYVTPTAAGSGSPMPMARHRQNSAVSEELFGTSTFKCFHCGMINLNCRRTLITGRIELSC